jgi:hypothetical protein
MRRMLHRCKAHASHVAPGAPVQSTCVAPGAQVQSTCVPVRATALNVAPGVQSTCVAPGAPGATFRAIACFSRFATSFPRTFSTSARPTSLSVTAPYASIPPSVLHASTPPSVLLLRSSFRRPETWGGSGCGGTRAGRRYLARCALWCESLRRRIDSAPALRLMMAEFWHLLPSTVLPAIARCHRRRGPAF